MTSDRRRRPENTKPGRSEKASPNVISSSTARRREEEDLRRFAAVVRDSNDAITIQDFEGGITAWNRGAELMYGYSEEEALRSNINLLTPPDKVAEQTAFIQRLAAGEAVTSFETQRVTKDGRILDVWMTVTRLVDKAGNPFGIASTERDTTERRQAESERERLFERQIVLNRVTLALGAMTELPTILRALHDEARTLLNADGFFVSRYHKGSGLITALFAIDAGTERDVSTFPSIPLASEGRGMQSQVLRTGKPMNVPDWVDGERKMQTVHHIAPDGTFTPPPPETERDGCTKSALLVPLMLQGEPISVLQVQSNRLNAYSREDEDLLGGLANVAAISIQNALLIAQAEHAAGELRLSLEGTLRAVSRASETRDPYTAGHQHRVTDLAVAIARELGCSDDECNTLRIAGTLHDIGKLGIPAEILSKPGTLSPIEFALIREHPQIARDILADVPFPGPVAEIVLQHHERLDGSGYPRGLKVVQVLREARILAVADVIEAMASHRPYRPARGIDAALGEIEQNAGRLYDSEAVAACIHLFRDKGYALPA
jgi:PAS domain S-box-containing protein